MFERIWKGWLDGWNKVWVALRHDSFWAFMFVVLVAAFTAAELMVSLTVGVVLAGMQGLNLVGFIAGGAFVYFGILVPSIAKFVSWRNRNGPDKRRPLHNLWESFKKSRIATWWLEGMARLMVWATDHGLLAGTILIALFIAFYVALFKVSEAILPILLCSTLFLIAVFPYLSYALSRFWRRIFKTPHLLC